MDRRWHRPRPAGTACLSETSRAGSADSAVDTPTGSRRNCAEPPADCSSARRRRGEAPCTRDCSCRACRAASTSAHRSRRAVFPTSAARPLRGSVPARGACVRRQRARHRAMPLAPAGSSPCRACRSTSDCRAGGAPSQRLPAASAGGRDSRWRVTRIRSRRRRRLSTESRDRGLRRAFPMRRAEPAATATRSAAGCGRPLP